jgi:lincosamide nucleotidyltransferase A/C/D/E
MPGSTTPSRAAVRDLGVRAARFTQQALKRSPAARALRWEPLQRLRWRLLTMSLPDTLRVLDAIEAAGAQVWLAGGWGVDALLGEPTRRHHDLDLVLDADRDDEDRARAALADVGICHPMPDVEAAPTLPHLAKLRDGAGHIVDLLPVDPDTLPEADQGPFTTGMLDGRPVRCLSAPVQVALHCGYEPRPADVHDVTRLCARFGLELPVEYRPRSRGGRRRQEIRLAR